MTTELPRRPGGSADHPESGPEHDIRRKAEVHDVEGVEDLGAELQYDALRIRPDAYRRVLDQRQIDIVKRRAPECIRPSVPNLPLFGPVPPGTLIGIENS